MIWKHMTKPEIKDRVYAALAENRNYDSDYILGIPGTYLDTEQFHRDAHFLDDAPFLRTFINNPNHIGCHTLTGDEGEDMFRGTQKIEVELIRMISEEILNAEAKSVDGYVAPGGTEANIQALWIYRNYYQKEFNAKANEIAVVFSSDSHYSFYKGANILGIKALDVAVDPESRSIDMKLMQERLQAAKQEGIKYFIAIANMSTTLFGSVDDPDEIGALFESMELPYKLHVDGAFGGFIYPFTDSNSKLHFGNPRVHSVTMDAHKMLMAPYGTGVFMIRKDWMHYAATSEASYVQGLDYTMVGSRSGAQAISIWMILMTHGPRGWKNMMERLIIETDKLCSALDDMGIRYFRHPSLNIVSMYADQVPNRIPQKYRLVSDNFGAKPKWWKIVVMQHTIGKVVDQFIADMRSDLA
ncbi:MAG: pyridoxal phosphate-dependent decarboxylase family protein [Croceimicrobium sp.]